LHTEKAEDGVEGAEEFQDEGAIVGGGKGSGLSPRGTWRGSQIYSIVKDPRAAAGRSRIEDAVETVDDVGGDEAAALAFGETGIVVEKDVVPQMKGPRPPVCGNLPGASEARHEVQLVVGLHERVVELMNGPLDGTVLRLCRVEGGDPIGLVIPEDLLIGMRVRSVTSKEDEVNYEEAEIAAIDYLHSPKNIQYP